MDTREYDRAKEYHAELVRISEQARRLKSAFGRQPSLFDRALLFTGNTLIALGQKMKQRVVVYHLADERL